MLLERTVICFKCKSVLTEREDAPLNERAACPTCGSRDRAVQVVTAGLIRSLDDLQLDFQGDPENISGLEQPEEAGEPANAIQSAQLVIVQREFSPDCDSYVEHVEDQATGTVLWHLESPLTEWQARAAEGASDSAGRN
jgi:hypothetical protein